MNKIKIPLGRGQTLTLLPAGWALLAIVTATIIPGIFALLHW